MSKKIRFGSSKHKVICGDMSISDWLELRKPVQELWVTTQRRQINGDLVIECCEHKTKKSKSF